MPLSRRLARLLLCLCLLVVAAAAHAEKLPFKSYTTSEGLAHDRVNRIVKDLHGFLWFCTSEGLSRFDGYEFKNYTQDDGLPHRSIADFLETRGGEFWIATGDGVVLFDPAGMSKREQSNENKNDAPMFRVVRPTEARAAPQTWRASKLLEDRDGTIWVASVSGLYRLGKSGADDWQLERFDDKGKWQNTNNGFLGLLEDRTGAIWGGNASGLYRISPDRSNVRIIAPKLSVISLLEDRDGRIWVGAGGNEVEKGLHVFSYVGDEVRQLRVFGKKDGLIADLWMNALLETADGRIFVGVGNGLCEYTPQADSSQSQFRTLSNEGIVALAEDASGNVWFSTGSNGVRRIARNGFVSFDESDGIKNKSTTSIIAGADGEMYILPEQLTIGRFNGKSFDTVKPFKMMRQSWGEGQLTFRDHAGEWWIAGTQGLQRYPKTERLEDLAHTAPRRTYTMRDGLFANEIFQLFEDSRGDIWISVIGEVVNTVLRWERATDRIHGYTTEDGLPSRNGAVAYGEDRAGNVWLGFYSGGLLRFRNGKFEAFTAADGLPPGFINNIFTDSAGRVWVATSTGGVVRIDDPAAEEKPRLANLTTRDGLSSNQATCTTEDRFGRIYIGTGRGINRLDLRSGRIKLFTKADGLPENIVSLCNRDASGALWFATQSGLARYTPIAEERSAPPPIFLSALRVNGEPIKNLSELGETAVENLELASDQRQVQVDFFALGFGTGETLRYQYNLNGSDSDWSEPTTLRTVNLNLSPGAYKFMVRAVSADGAISQTPAVVTFSIARPVWQRWWFLVSASLLVGLSIYALYRYRLGRLLEVERVRTRIATDLHDDIGASLSRVAILSEVVKLQTDGTGSQSAPLLTEIADSARGLVDSMSDIVWSIDPKRDDLHNVVVRVRQFASDVLEARGIEWDFRVAPEVEKLKLDPEQRRHLYLIFKEGINNVVRHAGDVSSVALSVELAGGHLVGEIKDDGQGFAPKPPGEPQSNGRGGNGLPNMRARAEGVGGRLDIESAPGAGTRLLLHMPLK